MRRGRLVTYGRGRTAGRRSGLAPAGDGGHPMGLGAIGSPGFDELDGSADLQMLEWRMHDVVAAEIELATAVRRDETETLIGVEARHRAVENCFVGLDVATLLAGRVLELAGGRSEGVTQRDVHVLVRVVVGDDLSVTGNADVDVDLEAPPLLAVLAGLGNDDSAARDAGVKALQARGAGRGRRLDLSPDRALIPLVGPEAERGGSGD